MRAFLGILLAAALPLGTASGWGAEKPIPAPDPAKANAPLPEEYSCTFCHADGETFSGETQHLLVTEKDLLGDIHWEKGLRCHDCHGGNPSLEQFVDHRKDTTFHSLESPAEIPTFCGRCHSDIEYMRRFSPSARTDQEKEYWTSGHGQALKGKGDTGVATCVSCHGRHGILAVENQNSPVYPTRVAQTCSGCHSDEKLMAGRVYHGRAIGHDQYRRWRKSVHGQAMLTKGDLSAPACNDCHGNHGAVPPEVGSVANACGTCHGKQAKLFAQTQMKHKFEEVGLPGCATCHGAHEIRLPSDENLGMNTDAFCARCHEKGKYGATLAGADVARKMRDGLEDLKNRIARAETTIGQAERLGMEVRGPRFDLHQAHDDLTNARSLVHTFSPDRLNQALEEGRQLVAEIQKSADAALTEHTARRVWLALSLIPILIVIVLLLLYIRTLPKPSV